MMKAASVKEAWNIADGIISGDYIHDGYRSQRAGYDVYVSTNGSGEYISDLGNRLEVNKADGTSVNIWIEEGVDAEVLGVPAKQTTEKTFYAILSNGKRVDIIKDAEYENKDTDRVTVWPWKIDTQYFSKDEYAKAYLKTLIAEKLTGIRIIYHAKREVPDICGSEGRACRHPNKCNTMLCSSCPVAEKFFADRDKVTIVYMS
jgi:hypothetical protein